DGALTSPGVTVEGDLAGGQAGQRRNETHDGTRVADVDRRGATQRGGGHQEVGAVGPGRGHLRSQCPQRARHQLTVPTDQGTTDQARCFRQRGQYQGTVGHRLRTGQREAGLPPGGPRWGRASALEWWIRGTGWTARTRTQAYLKVRGSG